MNRVCIQYLRLEIKKYLKILKRLSVKLVLLMLFAGLCTGALYIYITRLENHFPVRAALVIPGEQKDVSAAVGLLLGVDSIKNTMEFVYPEKEEAYKMMADEEIQAAIIFGEDFINNVKDGINTPIEVIMPSDSSISTRFFKETINSGIYMIDIIEAVSYSMIDAWNRYKITTSLEWMENELLEVYVNEAAAIRNNMEVRILSDGAEIPILEHYITAGLVLLLFIFGISFWGMYDNRDYFVERRLRLYGVGIVFRTVCRIIVMTMGFLILSVLLMLIFCFIGKITDVFVIQISIKKIIRLFLPSFTMACIYHSILSLGRAGAQRRRILTLAVLIMLLLGGCIVPASYFPDFINRVKSFIPFSEVFHSVRSIMFGHTYEINTLLIWGILFLTVGIFYELISINRTENLTSPQDGMKSFKRAVRSGNKRQLLFRAGLFIKWQIKQKTPVVEVVLFILFIVIAGSIRLPMQTNEILVCADSDGFYNESCGLFNESAFTWTYEENEDEAKMAVKSGKALAAVKEEDGKLIVYTAVFTPEVMVARDTLSVAYFSKRHKELLRNIFRDYFEENKEMYGEVLKGYDFFMKSDRLFRVNYKENPH